MATANKNLSDYDKDAIPNGSSYTIGISVSEWNEQITKNLLIGAYNTLLENGVKEESIIIKRIPGAFELPLASQFLLEDGQVDGVIAIGSVIRGETSHFDYVCQGVTYGIQQVALKYNKPVIFCVLTDNSLQQSLDRSGGKHGNKGIEAAVAALKMLKIKG